MGRDPRTRPGLPSTGGASSSVAAAEGHLLEDLQVNGSASMRVYKVISGTWTATDETRKVRDRAGFFGSTGDYILVLTINGEPRPVVVGCVSFAEES